MKKRIAVAAAFAACLAVCAAVWPQNEPTGEIPAPPELPAVITTQPEVPKILEIEEIIMPEEKADVIQPDLIEEVSAALTPTPSQTLPVNEVQATPEQTATPQQEPEPTPALPDSVPDNMVYVEGFGWIESQGPNHCECAKDMYENGNKIGRMN